MADSSKQNKQKSNVINDILAGRISLPKGVTMPYVIFCLVLVFMYISNRLQSEVRLRQISDLEAEIKELGYVSTTTQSELMNMSKQSEILRRTEAENLELYELTEPPRIVER